MRRTDPRSWGLTIAVAVLSSAPIAACDTYSDDVTLSNDCGSGVYAKGFGTPDFVVTAQLIAAVLADDANAPFYQDGSEITVYTLSREEQAFYLLVAPDGRYEVTPDVTVLRDAQMPISLSAQGWCPSRVAD